MERLGDPPGSLISQVVLAWALLTDHGRREEARGRLEHAHQLAKQLGDRDARRGGRLWAWPLLALDGTPAARPRPLPPGAGAAWPPGSRSRRSPAPCCTSLGCWLRDEPVRAARLAGAGLATAERGGVHLPARCSAASSSCRVELGQRLGNEQVTPSVGRWRTSNNGGGGGTRARPS